MALLRGRAANCSTVDNAPDRTPVAEPGDLAIVQEKYTSLTPLILASGKHTDNRYGRFPHDALLGRPLGTRWHSAAAAAASGSQQCAGFVHALAPTPELWSMAMHHRTQIVYPHDAAIIALYLDLRPGSVLVESGTGSGSATAAFARVVAPHGKVHTFEFHAERAAAARAELRTLVGGVGSVYGGVDVTRDGFVGVADQSADAVFLDIPMPFVMGRELRRVLKPNGTVCTFSPCVEQVARSVKMLREGGFHSVRTVTAPVRTYETREQVLATPGFDELAGARSAAGSGSSEEDAAGEPERKRRRGEGNGAATVTEKDLRRKSRTAGAERLAVSAMADGAHEGRMLRPRIRLHSRPYASMKGHTSYLTFARRWLDLSGVVEAGEGGEVGDEVRDEVGDGGGKGDAAGAGGGRRESCSVV